MFSLIRKLLRRRRKPKVVFIRQLDADILADRVQRRLQTVGDTEAPLEAMFKIAHEESLELITMAQLREMMRIREAIHKLPPRQRAVLVDHVERGLTYKEIARERGMTERIVLRDLTRAYASLRIDLMEKIDERSNSNLPGPVSCATCEQFAGVRDSASDVEFGDRVHSARAPGGGLSGGPVEQRPDANSG